MKKGLIACIIGLIVGPVLADSPLTSTPFYKAYMENDMVSSAKSGGLTKKHMDYLSNEDIGMDNKLAVINAISWGDTTVVHKFETYLIKKYNKINEQTFVDLRYKEYKNIPPVDAVPELTGDELASWAYLDIMGDYFHPGRGWNATIIALQKEKENASYGLVMNLLRCQFTMDKRVWCNVYLEHANFKVMSYSVDAIKDEAMAIIDNYIGIYQEDCNEDHYQAWEAEYGVNLRGDADFETFEVSGTVTVDDRTVWILDSNTVKTKEGYFKNLTLTNKQKVDVEIVEILYPEWIGSYDEAEDGFEGSEIKVEIKNKGNVATVNFVALLEENRGDNVEFREGMDYFKAAVIEVEALAPGEKRTITFRIDKHWVFDPNCEIKVTLDYLNQMEEKNEKNNVQEYEAYG